MLQLDAGEEGNPLFPPRAENHEEAATAAPTAHTSESNIEPAPVSAHEERAAAVAAAMAAEESH